jgi:hypothetical protein
MVFTDRSILHFCVHVLLLQWQITPNHNLFVCLLYISEGEGSVENNPAGCLCTCRPNTDTVLLLGPHPRLFLHFYSIQRNSFWSLAPILHVCFTHSHTLGVVWGLLSSKCPVLLVTSLTTPLHLPGSLQSPKPDWELPHPQPFQLHQGSYWAFFLLNITQLHFAKYEVLKKKKNHEN